ncbi:sensor histidine kinase [Paenibacillus sp. NFR01]|uniref:cache domain-containing sensor histidine kinase n=1 Tax=Paenibacillus sp. NFR01 TaxID=1566279 RepID=UPI0008CF5554|nr:sensor histidine kinase [Paenibacillus sp. NFR01]SEU18033.1 two-component system, sensor histidine kinase YesM [Paenibacillus sp. NFR01]
MARFLRFYRNWSVTTKFVMIFVSILLVSLVLTGYTLYKQAAGSAIEQAQTIMEQNLLQTKASIEEKIKMTENISQIIAFDSRIQTLLDSDFTNESFQLQDYRDNVAPSIDNIMRQNPYIHSIHVYMSNPQIPELYGGYDGFFGLRRVESDPNYSALLADNSKKSEWRSVHKEKLLLVRPDVSAVADVLSYNRKIYSFHDFGIAGLVEIEITEKELFKSLRDSVSGTLGNVYIVDGNGRIVSDNIPEAYGENAEQVGLGNWITGGAANRLASVNGTRSIVISIPLSGPNLRIIGAFPVSHVVQKVQDSLYTTLFVLAAALLVLSLFVYFVTVKLLSRMKQLLKAMKQVREDSLGVSVPVIGNDEFSQMTHSFNHMTQRIHDLVERVYKSELLEREAEVRALESQINPHFLYNTLATISWVARKAKAPDVARISDSLAKFYRLVLNKGSSETLIQNELEMVKAYLAIQKFRFEDRFDAVFEVEDEVKDFVTLKNILQPLVENALVHGIEPKRSHGTIIIKASVEDGWAVLRIIDDGVGMTAQRIADIQAERPLASSGSGYAVANITSRLRSHYGEEHRLELFSRLGIGTVITISFKARRLI